MTAEQVVNTIAVLGALVVLVPATVFFLECFAALLARTERPGSWEEGARPAVVVLVPAHNEEQVIARTLESLLTQLSAKDRLLVVADNCTDDTALIAKEMGAEVYSRQDENRRGKGYALAFGVDQLRNDPPAVVVIVDADCHAHAGLLDGLLTTVVATGRPAQGIYLIESPADPSPKDSISAFALVVKNQVRPMGCHRLGMPCQLTGAGMAFPWSALQSVELASGNIVEDMQLGLDLAQAGRPPILCPAARVSSTLPAKRSAATTQRTRWEQGHLRTMRANLPRLFFGGLRRCDLGLFGLALDLCVPPLSFLIFLWLLISALAASVALWSGWWMPVWLLSTAGGLIAGGVAISWLRFGRHVCSLGTFLSLPFYLLWKVKIYLGFIFRPQTKWVRTDRDEAE